MLSRQTIGADSLFTLDASRKRLCEGLNKTLVDEVFASALFRPQPNLFVNLRRVRRHAVLLLCGKILAWLRHIHAFQSATSGRSTASSSERSISGGSFGIYRLTILYFSDMGLEVGPVPHLSPPQTVPSFARNLTLFCKKMLIA